MSVDSLPGRAVAGSMLDTELLCHRLRHCTPVRPGTSAAIASQLVMDFLPLFFLQKFVTAIVSFHLLLVSSEEAYPSRDLNQHDQQQQQEEEALL
jgi:hypothetical protein